MAWMILLEWSFENKRESEFYDRLVFEGVAQLPRYRENSSLDRFLLILNWQNLGIISSLTRPSWVRLEQGDRHSGCFGKTIVWIEPLYRWSSHWIEESESSLVRRSGVTSFYDHIIEWGMRVLLLVLLEPILRNKRTTIVRVLYRSVDRWVYGAEMMLSDGQEGVKWMWLWCNMLTINMNVDLENGRNGWEWWLMLSIRRSSWTWNRRFYPLKGAFWGR